MYRFLLEDVWKLLLCWAGVQFVLICLWSWTRDRRIATANWVALILGLALAVLSISVTTPAEEAIAACRQVAKAIDDGDMDALSAHLASDFEAREFDKDRLLEQLERTLTRVRVDHPRLSGFEVTVESDTAIQAVFRATCQIRTAEFVRSSLPSKWRLRFRRSGEAWLITGIESLPVPPLNVRVLADWFR